MRDRWRRLKNFFILFGASSVKLWLDDVRPAPFGWYHATTAAEAEDILSCFFVTKCSLDHDLGQCDKCGVGNCAPGWSKDCLCTCHETGYDLVKWMAQTNMWPNERPNVHSANPVGRQNMNAVIDRYGEYDSL